MNDDATSRAGRRATDPLLADKAAASPSAHLPVPVTVPVTPPEPGAAAFDAQLYGQGGQKRGLRGGKPVLDLARATYLETEWSGPADRRPAKGMLTKTRV
jgi:hypothetical protein